MKLYRGLKSNEYKEFNEELINKFMNGWEEIVKGRQNGDLSYPIKLDRTIKELYENESLVKQNFTDNKEIAIQYAKKEKGLLIEIEVAEEDILKYFIPEFQNYAKRKQLFEVVYVVKGADLFLNRERWKLKVIKI